VNKLVPATSLFCGRSRNQKFTITINDLLRLDVWNPKSVLLANINIALVLWPFVDIGRKNGEKRENAVGRYDKRV